MATKQSSLSCLMTNQGLIFDIIAHEVSEKGKSTAIISQ